MRTTIEIRGARENNLQNVSLEIPRDKLVVVTGMSGSGKSSLAFDTVYAEGQRRLLASMSTFAKRFIGQLKAIPNYSRPSISMCCPNPGIVKRCPWRWMPLMAIWTNTTRLT